MTGIGILRTASYLPSVINTNAEVCKNVPGMTEEWILSKLGIKQRWYVADDETASSMSTIVAKELIRNIYPSEIGLIIIASFSQDYVFPPIRQAQPAKLLVVADGPRNEAEALLCQQTREVTERVDWDCEVLRNYSDENLGCRQRVSSGLDWVFEKVEEAIVLEDDCLPHPSFFRYCQELLDYYRDDERICSISGNNFQDGQLRGDSSYYFSNHYHCWGWASWRRAWQQYDRYLVNWPAFRDGRYLEGILDSALEVQYWQSIFERLYSLGKPNSWSYAWTFTCWQNRGLTALPNVNLVSNIGFRTDGTHTWGESKLANMPVGDIGELRHPAFIARDRAADMYTFDRVFGGLQMREALQEAQRWQNRLRRRAGNLKRRILAKVHHANVNADILSEP